MKIGLAGYGSIGKRHIRNLLSLGFSDIILYRSIGRGNEFSLREEHDFKSFLKNDFDFVIISNPTTYHSQTALPLIKSNRNLLIEKPLVFRRDEFEGMKMLLPGYLGLGMVAYNMRFHPAVSRVKELMMSGVLGNVWSARFFVGQYLPEWRPDQDYRKSVSALYDLGGGVVLELIHEIDLALYLFGKPGGRVFSVARRSSDLEIETEDIAETLFLSEKNVIISIHQDYLNRDYRRLIEIVAENGTLCCDLKKSSIQVVSEKGSLMLDETIPFERNDMYLAMMKYYINCLTENKKPAPDLIESLDSISVALEVKEANNL